MQQHPEPLKPPLKPKQQDNPGLFPVKCWGLLMPDKRASRIWELRCPGSVASVSETQELPEPGPEPRRRAPKYQEPAGSKQPPPHLQPQQPLVQRQGLQELMKQCP